MAIKKFKSEAAHLADLLRWYVEEFPALRVRPIGAPNSDARQKQKRHVEIEVEAKAALAKAGV